MAGTAPAHGINANIVHKWRLKARCGNPAGVMPNGFIPIAMHQPQQASPTPNTSAGSRPTEPIEISVQRGAVHVRVAWPVQAAGNCAAWLAELIR